MPEKKCTGECIKCTFQQQVYCAAQHGHAIMAFMPAIIERLDRLESRFGRADIFNPLEKEEAQNVPGAENRADKNYLIPQNNGLL